MIFFSKKPKLSREQRIEVLKTKLGTMKTIEKQKKEEAMLKREIRNKGVFGKISKAGSTIAKNIQSSQSPKKGKKNKGFQSPWNL